MIINIALVVSLLLFAYILGFIVGIYSKEQENKHETKNYENN